MPTTPITNWGQAIMTSVTASLAMVMAAIPRIIGFLLILIIGWLVASLIAAAFAGLLRVLRFDDLSRRSGLSGLLEAMEVRRDASGVVGEITKWVIRLVVILAAFDVLGFPAMSQALRELLLWLPNLAVALVVLVVGGLIANAVYGLVRGSSARAGFGSPEVMGNIARIAVWGFAIIVAVSQLGIATALVNTLFFGIVAALALALGLAFGLGGRDTAAEIVRDWYRSGKQAAPRLERAGKAAQAAAEGREAEAGKRERPAA